jgi:type III pantothenate kinase
MKILVVNAGNTRTSVAIVADEKVKRIKFLQTSDTRYNDCSRIINEVAGKTPVDGCALCSVVPQVNRTWIKAMSRTLKILPLQINYKLKLGISLSHYKQPETLGADRIANSAGASAKYGAPVIVADFGTAMTIDIVSSERNYMGGVIAPGPALMTEYLADMTALLPHMRFTGTYPSIGRTTKEAIMLGAGVGYRGMVKELLNHFLAMDYFRNAKICITGGYAKVILKQLKNFDLIYDPYLTHYGIAVIWRLNNSL